MAAPAHICHICLCLCPPSHRKRPPLQPDQLRLPGAVRLHSEGAWRAAARWQGDWLGGLARPVDMLAACPALHACGPHACAPPLPLYRTTGEPEGPAGRGDGAALGAAQGVRGGCVAWAAGWAGLGPKLAWRPARGPALRSSQAMCHPHAAPIQDIDYCEVFHAMHSQYERNQVRGCCWCCTGGCGGTPNAEWGTRRLPAALACWLQQPHPCPCAPTCCLPRSVRRRESQRTRRHSPQHAQRRRLTWRHGSARRRRSSSGGDVRAACMEGALPLAASLHGCLAGAADGWLGCLSGRQF